MFLDCSAATLAPDEHAAVVVDGAGRHVAHDLRVPTSVSLVPPPPRSPELNPAERVRPCLREHHPGHRPLADRDAIVDAPCAAWNALTPDRLLSATRYPHPNRGNPRARPA